MKLYYAPGACSLAPHIAAREAGLTLDLAKVDLAAKTVEGGGSYREINAKGSVPALELDAGGLLTENAVILQYLAEQAPQSGLMSPTGSVERWRLLELLNYVATELHKGFGPLWNSSSSAEVRAATIETLGRKFDFLDRQLGDKSYLLGETFTIADAYAFTVLNWTGVLKVPFERWPRLQGFLGRVAARPAVQTALREEGLLG